MTPETQTQLHYLRGKAKIAIDLGNETIACRADELMKAADEVERLRFEIDRLEDRLSEISYDCMEWRT